MEIAIAPSGLRLKMMSSGGSPVRSPLPARRAGPGAFAVDHLRAVVGGHARAWRLAREARQFGQDAGGQDVAAAAATKVIAQTTNDGVRRQAQTIINKLNKIKKGRK